MMLYLCWARGEEDLLLFEWVSAETPLAATEEFGRTMAKKPRPEWFPRGDYWVHIFPAPDEAAVRAEKDTRVETPFVQFRYSMAVGSDGRTEVYTDEGDGDVSNAPPPEPPKRRRRGRRS